MKTLKINFTSSKLPFFNEVGIGLIEVVMASGILAVIALGIANLVASGQQGAMSVQKRTDASQLQATIGTILNNSTVCTSSLAGSAAPVLPYTPDTLSVPTLSFAGSSFDDSGGPNSSYDNGQIKIVSLKYHTATAVGSLYTAVVRMQVSVQSNANQNVVGGNVLAPVDFPLIFNVNGAGNIVNCGGTAGVARTCNANGCYRIEADGTIEQWGTLFCPATTCFITFPYSFTTTANLSLTATAVVPGMGNITTVLDTPSVSGATVYNHGVVNVGGSGFSYNGGGTNNWRATGY